MRIIIIDGKVYEWKHILRLRRQQMQDGQRSSQLTLFELKEDHRPASQCTADGRYSEPTLFKVD